MVRPAILTGSIPICEAVNCKTNDCKHFDTFSFARQAAQDYVDFYKRLTKKLLTDKVFQFDPQIFATQLAALRKLAKLISDGQRFDSSIKTNRRDSEKMARTHGFATFDELKSHFK